MKLGDTIIVRTAQPHNGSCDMPAIVNRVWTDKMVNCTVLPDCGAPYTMTSVVVHGVQPASPEPGRDGWLP